MSLLYKKTPKLQSGGPVNYPRDIDQTTSDNYFDDADSFISESYRDPEILYKALSEPEEHAPGHAEAVKPEDSPVNFAVGSATLKEDYVHLPALRDDLPFENEFEWLRYRDFINEKEMSGRTDSDSLKKFNPYGYVGAFQLGTMALQEAGYLKSKLKGAGQRRQILDPDNWKGGAKMRDAFLTKLSVQEDALKKYTARNFRYIKNHLVTHGIIAKDKVMAYLAGTHLSGQKNVKKYIKDNGSSFRDGNGTTIDTYINGFRNWLKDRYKDGQGLSRKFNKRKAEETLRQKGILIRREDYFPEEYRVPGDKTQPWQE